MALIARGKTKCALCDSVLKVDDEIVATSHFIADIRHPLYRFSDAGMHKTCFLNWDQRQAFADLFNQLFGSITWGDGTNKLMRDDCAIVSLPRRDKSS
jgi:hypothetical protein